MALRKYHLNKSLKTVVSGGMGLNFVLEILLSPCCPSPFASGGLDIQMLC
jgi:hypothetical protein